MNTFIFGQYVYENPLFMVKAVNREELPKVFGQLESLRRSGYLAGYIRYDLVSPVPDDPVLAGPHKEPTPYIHCVLYKRRRELPLPKAKGDLFCPAIRKPLSPDVFKSQREDILKEKPDADVFLTQEVRLATRLEGRRLFDEWAAVKQDPNRAYFQDAFEELVCPEARPLVRMTRQGPDDYTIQLYVDNEADRDAASVGLAAISEPGSIAANEEGLTARARKGLTSEELVRAVFPGPTILGRTGRPDEIFSLEHRRRGIFGGVFCLFSAKEIFFATPVFAMEKRFVESEYRLGVGARINSGLSGEEAVESMHGMLQRVAVPDNLSFTVSLRMEEGKVYLLKEKLRFLSRVCREHDIPDTAIMDVLRELPQTGLERAVPGEQGDFALDALASAWYALPESVGSGLALDGVRLLTVRVSPDGALAFSAEVLTEPSSRTLEFSRKALDDRNDYLQLPVAETPWFAKTLERIAEGQCLDDVYVNRLGVAVGGARCDLVFRTDDGLVTPPAEAGCRNGILRQVLLEKRVVREKPLGLQEVVTCREVYAVSDVYGVLSVTLSMPKMPGRAR